MLVARQLLRASQRITKAPKASKLRRGFAWWSFSKKTPQEAPPEPKDEDPKDMENLYYLIDNLKKQNSQLGSIF